jgi:hypothetical protein
MNGEIKIGTHRVPFILQTTKVNNCHGLIHVTIPNSTIYITLIQIDRIYVVTFAHQLRFYFDFFF